jgi:chlorophyll synthase
VQASQQTDAPNKTEADSNVRQMLGMKGAAEETDKFKIRVQLTKPVTWVPLIWGVVCGAAASGNYVWNNPEDIAKLLTCCMMSGPFLTGYTQTINDYYDREIDAINEPYRPIPSGNCYVMLCYVMVWHVCYICSGQSGLLVPAGKIIE